MFVSSLSCIPLSFQLLLLLPQFGIRPLSSSVGVLAAFGAIRTNGRLSGVAADSPSAAVSFQQAVQTFPTFLSVIAVDGHYGHRSLLRGLPESTRALPVLKRATRRRAPEVVPLFSVPFTHAADMAVLAGEWCAA